MESPLTTRAALLLALRSGPGYGLDLIARVARMTSGLLRLRQGSVYPALQALAEEGFLARWSVTPGRRRGGRSRTYFELTERGSALADTHRRALAGCSVRPCLGLPRAEIQRMRERVRRGAELSLFALKLRGRARKA